MAHRGPPRGSGALPGGDASGRHARPAAGLPSPKLGGPGRRYRALGQGRWRRPGLDRGSNVEYRGRGDPSRLPGTRGEWGLGRGRVGLGVEDAAGRTPRRSNLGGLGEPEGGASTPKRKPTLAEEAAAASGSRGGREVDQEPPQLSSSPISPGFGAHQRRERYTARRTNPSTGSTSACKARAGASSTRFPRLSCATTRRRTATGAGGALGGAVTFSLTYSYRRRWQI